MDDESKVDGVSSEKPKRWRRFRGWFPLLLLVGLVVGGKYLSTEARTEAECLRQLQSLLGVSVTGDDACSVLEQTEQLFVLRDEWGAHRDQYHDCVNAGSAVHGSEAWNAIRYTCAQRDHVSVWREIDAEYNRLLNSIYGPDFDRGFDVVSDLDDLTPTELLEFGDAIYAFSDEPALTVPQVNVPSEAAVWSSATLMTPECVRAAAASFVFLETDMSGRFAAQYANLAEAIHDVETARPVGNQRVLTDVFYTLRGEYRWLWDALAELEESCALYTDVLDHYATATMPLLEAFDDAYGLCVSLQLSACDVGWGWYDAGPYSGLCRASPTYRGRNDECRVPSWFPPYPDGWSDEQISALLNDGAAESRESS